MVVQEGQTGEALAPPRGTLEAALSPASGPLSLAVTWLLLLSSQCPVSSLAVSEADPNSYLANAVKSTKTQPTTPGRP